MPEVELTIRWADGTLQSGVSPSRAIGRFLVQHAVYPRDELVARLRQGLAEASERVRRRYGFACTSAAQLRDELIVGATDHGGSAADPARVEQLRELAPTARFPPPTRMASHVDVVVVGGGQAGLSVSWHLRQRGIEHLVLERDRLAGTWRNHRWDSFCLVTPNWQCRLPGHEYAGSDPDGFMVKDEIVDYVESFAASFRPPLHEGVDVREVAREGRSGFRLATSHGELRANQVVLAVGGYHDPVFPALSRQLPDDLTQLHSSGYRNPSSLPEGAVLVVGSGQSGAQIAEDLQLAGRQVHLCVGSAPRVARFYRGRDCVAWLEDIGHYNMPIDEHPEGLKARHEPNHYVTGRDGGRDIDLRAQARDGMQLHGRLRDVRAGRLSFAPDLRENLDAADATSERIKDTIDRWIEAQGIQAPPEARYRPVWEPDGNGNGNGNGNGELDLGPAGIRTVIWATGFNSDWSWIHIPAFSRARTVQHNRGVTAVKGLYVVGLPWLYTWGSARFAGVGRDAEYLGQRIAGRARVPALSR